MASASAVRSIALRKGTTSCLKRAVSSCTCRAAQHAPSASRSAFLKHSSACTWGQMKPTQACLHVLPSGTLWPVFVLINDPVCDAPKSARRVPAYYAASLHEEVHYEETKAYKLQKPTAYAVISLTRKLYGMPAVTNAQGELSVPSLSDVHNVHWYECCCVGAAQQPRREPRNSSKQTRICPCCLGYVTDVIASLLSSATGLTVPLQTPYCHAPSIVVKKLGSSTTAVAASQRGRKAQRVHGA